MNSYSPIKLKFLAKLKSNPIFVKLRTAIQEGSYGILPPSESYVEGGNVTLLRATELKPDLEIDISTSPKVPQNFYNSKRACVQKHDILLAVKGATIASAKSVCYVKDEYENTIINGSIYRMSSKPHVIPKYFAYILDSPLTKRQMKLNLVANNAVDYLDSSIIHNLLVPIPPIEIQQQIIDQLDKSYAEKKAKEAEAERLLASVDGLVLDALGITLPDREENTLDKRIFFTKSSEISSGRFDAFYHLQSYREKEKALHNGKYEVVRLNSICTKVTDGTHFTPTYQDEGVLFLSVKNVRRETLNLRDVKYISAKEHAELIKRCKPEADDILLTKVGTIGLACVIPQNLPEFSLFVSVALLKPKKDLINSRYLSAFLNCALTKFQSQRAVKGVGVPDWHLENIRHLEIPIPPPEVQAEIAEQVEAIYAEAKRLREEGKETLKQAKLEVEKMILGEG